MSILGDLPKWPEFKWDPKALERAYKQQSDFQEEHEETLYQEPENNKARNGGVMTFDEIGAFFGISKWMAMKIYKSAVNKLKKTLPKYGITAESILDSPECHYDGATNVLHLIDKQVT